MAQPSDVTNLLRAASRAETYGETERFVIAAEDARGEITAQANFEREVDLGNAILHDHLTPVSVHEHHTASTDWVGTVDTSGGAGVEQEMIAQGSLWYGGLHALVKADQDEFEQQAVGWARRTAGSYGEQADVAEMSFLTHVGTLRARDARQGAFEAASGLPQIGEPGTGDSGGLGIGPGVDAGLPGDMTSSNRAPAMQAMEGDGGGQMLPQDNPDVANGDEGDRTDDTLRATSTRHVAEGFSVGSGHPSDMAWNRWGNWKPGWDAHQQGFEHGANGMAKDPELAARGNGIGQAYGEGHDLVKHYHDNDLDPEDHFTHHDWSGGRQFSQDLGKHIFGTNHERKTSMQTAPCPACAGHGKVAVRTQAASGLPQIDQIADAKDNPSQTPYPTEVAFEWEMDPNNQGRAIAETEQQLAEREQRKGASRQQLAERAAHVAAQYAYRRVLAGQDDSGWIGDMGAGGVQPGMQDGGNPGQQSNLGVPDPVYGFGGDQGQQDLKPYGADEANDYTNNPGMNWQPGQPTQADMAGRPNTVGQPTARRLHPDAEIARAQRFIAQRAAFLANQR